MAIRVFSASNKLVLDAVELCNFNTLFHVRISFGLCKHAPRNLLFAEFWIPDLNYCSQGAVKHGGETAMAPLIGVMGTQVYSPHILIFVRIHALLVLPSKLVKTCKKHKFKAIYNGLGDSVSLQYKGFLRDCTHGNWDIGV